MDSQYRHSDRSDRDSFDKRRFSKGSYDSSFARDEERYLREQSAPFGLHGPEGRSAYNAASSAESSAHDSHEQRRHLTHPSGEFDDNPGHSLPERSFFGSSRPRVVVPSGPHRGKGPKGWVRSDEKIHHDICEIISAHGELDASDVEVVVKNGEVTLTGTVDTRDAKRLTEDIAEVVQGVKDVHNRLKVAFPSQGGYPPSQPNGSSGDAATFH